MSGGIMAEIKQIESMYSKDYRKVFEDIANLMFCTELGLEKVSTEGSTRELLNLILFV